MPGKDNILLIKKEDFPHQTFGYHYFEPQSPPVQLHSLGWQMQQTDYYFDGTKRNEEAGNCIFQFTLSGCGVFEEEDASHTLRENTAFFAIIPSNHRYFLPKDSESWEFVFVTLSGSYAQSIWRHIIQQYGSVVKLGKSDTTINQFWKVYHNASQHNMNNGYQTSSAAYEFMMELLMGLMNLGKSSRPYDISIENSLKFMQGNLQNDISLDDISDAAGISKFYFNRSFLKALGSTPWTYLTKLRIECVANLLITTSLSLGEIAERSGFTNQNYLNKVFLRYVGITPGKFRRNYSGIRDFKINI